MKDSRDVVEIIQTPRTITYENPILASALVGVLACRFATAVGSD
jgi:hypothetical protein